MNNISFRWPFDGPKRASGREASSRRRRGRSHGPEGLQALEGRQLLASLSATYTASVPIQITDYNAPLSLPKFDASLGTLTEVDLTFSASGDTNGTVTNNGANPQDLTVSVTVSVALQDGATTLLDPNLSASHDFPQLAGDGGMAQFDQQLPTESASAAYTSGATFAEFAGGPGNVGLVVSTNTSQTATGAGGNIGTDINTTVGADATVVYHYTTLPVTLAGHVYLDANGTGSLAPGDPPIPGTVLTLLDASGTPIATTTTAADGTYSFTTAGGAELPAGTYFLAETQPAGYLQGINTVGTVDGATVGNLPSLDVIGSISLAMGQASINNNFGELLPVAIAGNVYEDVEGTKSLAPGDPPIVGVTLTLVDANGKPLATTQADAQGHYLFTTASGALLPPGTYGVYETQPAGYLQGTNTVGNVNGAAIGTLPAVDLISSIALTSGQFSVSNNFGEIRPVSVSGLVYVDALNVGYFVAGDPPIPGVTVTLFDASGPLESTTTNALGSYAFTTTSSGAPLPPGTYTVAETQPAGYLQGSNTIGTVNGVHVGNLPAVDVIGSIALTSGQASIQNNFGELTPAFHVTNVQRFGVHLQPTLVVLTFDTALDPSTAQDVANYTITGPLGGKHSSTIPIQSATYSPTTGLVTLRLGERLDIHQVYQLSVSGLKTPIGGLLTGSNGVPGGVYTSVINRTTLSGFTDIYGNFIPVDHGKLYPAANASVFQLKRFVKPANLGGFAASNQATYLAATAGNPEPAPISYRSSKKVHAKHH